MIFWTPAKPVKPGFHGFWPKIIDLGIFEFSWIFGIPKLPTLFEDLDPMWPLQGSYCLENARIWSLSILGFHETKCRKHWFLSVKVPSFLKTCFLRSSVWGQLRHVLCVHPHSGGVVGFSIIGFSIIWFSVRISESGFVGYCIISFIPKLAVVKGEHSHAP